MIGRTISHYRILAKLGEGGMGVVYKAEDLDLKVIRALKILPPHTASDEEQLARLETRWRCRRPRTLQHLPGPRGSAGADGQAFYRRRPTWKAGPWRAGWPKRPRSRWRKPSVSPSRSAAP